MESLVYPLVENKEVNYMILNQLDDKSLINVCYLAGNKPIMNFCDNNQDLWKQRLKRLGLDPNSQDILDFKKSQNNDWDKVYILLTKLNRVHEWLKKLGIEDLTLLELYNSDKLFLTNKRITEVPPEIGVLVNLESLTLSRNRLKRLPAEIGQLVNLKLLDVSSNPRLTDLPVEIGNLDKLHTLIIYNNDSITNVEEIAELLPNLRYFLL